MRSLNFEITVTFNSRNQGEYFNPNIERQKRVKKPAPPKPEEEELSPNTDTKE
jgi:hypothetical protein